MSTYRAIPLIRLLTLVCLLSMLAVGIAQDTQVQISRVIDGDTVELEDGTKVRLIGVDTPETVHPSKPVERIGKEASEYSRKQLEGTTVTLHYDPAQRTDRYGRVLAYVHLADGTDFNQKLIREGYAYAYIQYPHPRLEDYRAAESAARDDSVGLWSLQPTDATDRRAEEVPTTNQGKFWLNSGSMVLHNSGCRWYGNTNQGYYTEEILGRDCGTCGGAHRPKTITEPAPSSDITVYVTRTGSKYHRSSCRYLSKSKIAMPLSQAKLRYSPCSVCNPPR